MLKQKTEADYVFKVFKTNNNMQYDNKIQTHSNLNS